MISLGKNKFKDTERFTVLRHLGSGAFGTVYEVLDNKWEISVALKVLCSYGPLSLYRFKQEFRNLANVTHPNLVTLYELIADGEQCYFTMELVQGSNFLQYIRGDGYLLQKQPTASLPDLACLRAALSQLVEGIYILHKAGKLHRDIKPSNVLVSNDGRVVILDFGMVTELVPQESDDPLDESIDFLGTPKYMSPEQGAGFQVTEASDWYSVGIMLYEALTGIPPFNGSLLDIARKKQYEGVLPPNKLVSNVPTDLNDLCLDLLQPNPQNRPSGEEILQRLQYIPINLSIARPFEIKDNTIPFIGRERHLNVLKQALKSTQSGKVTIVHVQGSAGMGKSTLVNRFLEELAEKKDIVVLASHCYEQESLPYKILDGLVDSLSQYLRRIDPAETQLLPLNSLAVLTHIFPSLCQLQAFNPIIREKIDVTNPYQLKQYFFSALRNLVEQLAKQKLLILFIDDLQWGDYDSIVWLTDLLNSKTSPALMLICSYRKEEILDRPFLRAALPFRENNGLSIEFYELIVERLLPPEARELALILLGKDYPANTTCAEMVVRETQGNPFFINQLVQYLQTNAVFCPDQETDRVALATLDTVIQARINSLPEQAQRLLEILAIAGQPLEWNLARESAQLDNNAFRMISLLKVAQLISPTRAGEKEQLEISHKRIRDAVLANLHPDTIRAHYNNLAMAAEGCNSLAKERLMIYFRGAGNYEKAAKYAIVAAKLAEERLAFDHAALLYRLSIQLQLMNSSVELKELKIRLGDMLTNAGRGAEAAQAYLDAAQDSTLFEELELRRRAAEQLFLSGHNDKGREALYGVLKDLKIRWVKKSWFTLLLLMARQLYLRLRGIDFKECNESLIDDEKLIKLDAYYVIAKGLAMVDTLVSAEFQTRHIILALKIGEPYRILRALTIEITHSATGGGRTHTRTENLIQITKQLANRIETPAALALAVLSEGFAAWLEGRWKSAQQMINSAEVFLRKHCNGFTWEINNANIFLLRSMYYLGELNKLFDHLPLVLNDARKCGNIYTLTNLSTRVLYILFLAKDRAGQARSEVIQAIKRWSPTEFTAQHYFALVAQIEIGLYANQEQEAWRLLKEQWSTLKRSFLLHTQFLFIEILHLQAYLACAMAKHGNQDYFLKIAEANAAAIEKEQMPWGTALATMIKASAAATRRDRVEAIRLATIAEASFQSADMALYAAAACLRRGQLLGGEEGKLLIEKAKNWIKDQSINNPERMLNLLSPGDWFS
ncbi:MAG: protein kinase [Acidobacteriota bacterium]